MTRVAPLDTVGSPRSGSRAKAAKLCLLVITLLRIAANFYWGQPVERQCSGNISLLKDWNCPCDEICENPNSDLGGVWCECGYISRNMDGLKPIFDYMKFKPDYFAGCDEVNITWGYCWNPPFDPDRLKMTNKMFRLNEIGTDLLRYHPGPFFTACEDRIDIVSFVDYVVRPLISELGVYIGLSRPDRSSAGSRLHVWSYRSVLWIFVTSLFADDSITGLHTGILSMEIEHDNAGVSPRPSSAGLAQDGRDGLRCKELQRGHDLPALGFAEIPREHRSVVTYGAAIKACGSQGSRSWITALQLLEDAAGGSFVDRYGDQMP
eukprot:Skav218568  [mRNA]  locus=scaffold2610:126869:130766:+ [translate_table: standard]